MPLLEAVDKGVGLSGLRVAVKPSQSEVGYECRLEQKLAIASESRGLRPTVCVGR